MAMLNNQSVHTVFFFLMGNHETNMGYIWETTKP